jgi:outer membrane protein assembly factor BamD (BamD/ComL family)
MIDNWRGRIMRKYKRLFVTLAAVAGLFVLPVFSAETWRLSKEGQWKAVSAEDKYLLAVAEIKKLVNTGQTKAAGQAIDKLKKDFPEIAGQDLDVFMKAEMLYSEGKFTKAARAYDKFLAEFSTSEFYQAAMDRQFAIATAFLGGQKKRVLGVFKMSTYDEGIKIMEKISDRAGDAPIAKRAAVAVAQSYEKRGKFAEAYRKWSEISSRWPSGQIGKDALLNMARCKHAAYKGPKYNGSDLISAKSYYENFKLRYPEDAKKIDTDKILKQIDEQLAYKEFNTGKYYQQTGDKQSANLYYQMVVDNWPGSAAADMAKAAMKEKEPDAKKGKKWKKNITEKLEKLLL